MQERFIVLNRKGSSSSASHYIGLGQYKECEHLTVCTNEKYCDISKRQNASAWTKREVSAYTMFKKMATVNNCT
jgi:hypothetical protein